MLFEPSQIDRFAALLDRAEELVGDRFAVTSFRTPRYAYDVSTLAELSAEEVPRVPALAQIIRYGRPPAGRHTRQLGSFHRICLHDARILECHDREAVALDALLLVVFTHELIHLVRFTIPETTFHVSHSQRPAEEKEVDRLTRGLLLPYPDPDVARATEIVARS